MIIIKLSTFTKSLWEMPLNDYTRTTHFFFPQPTEPRRRNNLHQKLCFIDAPGGTGKTFLFNTIMAKYRSEQKICLGSASSGISSILLDGGKTVHSRFKIPLKLIDNLELKIRSQGNLGQLLIMSDCILIDEAPMLHRYIIEAIDKLLKKLMENNLPFGGKDIIFGGDFRQTLPVIPKANKASIIDKCFKNSYLWNELQKFKLDINVRVQLNGNNEENNRIF